MGGESAVRRGVVSDGGEEWVIVRCVQSIVDGVGRRRIGGRRSLSCCFCDGAARCVSSEFLARERAKYWVASVASSTTTTKEYCRRRRRCPTTKTAGTTSRVHMVIHN